MNMNFPSPHQNINDPDRQGRHSQLYFSHQQSAGRQTGLLEFDSLDRKVTRNSFVGNSFQPRHPHAPNANITPLYEQQQQEHQNYGLLSGDRRFSKRTANGSEVASMIHVTVEPTDVLCGRGKTSFNHVGNKRFRDLINATTEKYNNAQSRLEKSMVVHSIVEEVKKIKGRFLKQDRFTGGWYELDERSAKEKVGHAIRDATSNVYDSSKNGKPGVRRTKSNTIIKSKPTILSSSVTAFDKPQKRSSSEPMMDDSSGRSFAGDSSGRIYLTDDSSRRRYKPEFKSLEFISSADRLKRDVLQSGGASMDQSMQDLVEDFEPLHVDSLEAQNSIRALQNDDHFLKSIGAFIGTTGPASSNANDSKDESADEPNVFAPIRLEIVD